MYIKEATLKKAFSPRRSHAEFDYTQHRYGYKEMLHTYRWGEFPFHYICNKIWLLFFYPKHWNYVVLLHASHIKTVILHPEHLGTVKYSFENGTSRICDIQLEKWKSNFQVNFIYYSTGFQEHFRNIR